MTRAKPIVPRETTCPGWRGDFGSKPHHGCCMPHSKMNCTLVVAFIWLVQARAMVEPSLLSALQRVEEVYDRTDNDAMVRVNTMDVVGDVAFCRTVVMNPFSFPEDYEGAPTTTLRESMQYMAAVALAFSHLNAGDGSVIPELNGLQCNKKFTVEVADTGLGESQAAKVALSILHRRHHRPCALIGSSQPDVTALLATLTSLYEYPHISPISSASKLSNAEQYPYLARLSSPEGQGWAGPDPVLEYLHEKLGVTHLTLVYEDEPSTHEQIVGMVYNAERFFPEMHLKVILTPKNSGAEEIISVIQQVKRKDFRYVFAAFSADEYGKLFEAAVQEGIAGHNSSYTWIWANTAVEEYMNGREFTVGSPTFQALAGSLLISRIGSTPDVGRYAAFVDEWVRLSENTADIEFLRSKIPTEDLRVRQAFDGSTLSQESPQFPLVPLFYDSAILIGLAACANATDSFPNGPGHFNSIMNTTFVGASGSIHLTPESRARSQDAAMFRIWNFVPKKKLHGTVNLEKVQIASYANGSWIEPDDGANIVFADASFDVPPCLPAVVENHNYIGKHVGKVGFAMAVIVLILSFAFSKWTLVCRDQRIVRASQPVFLQLICIGTGLMGLSIAVLSFDDESIGNMDLICTSFPILLSLGWCFSFSAILSKTLRINIIFKNPRFRRIRVTPRDVTRPMLLLLSINVILLTTWALHDPLRWEREAILFDEYGRAIESFGFCTSTHAVSYTSLLLTVNIGVLGVTSFQSYVARNISTEFSESEYIAKAVGVVLLVSFMAIPIYQVSRENTKSRFLAMSSSIFVISLSLLLLIFVPKMFYRGKGVKAGIRQSLHFRVSDNDGDKSEGTRGSFDEDEETSEDSVGVLRITSHPKLSAQVEERLKTTKRENVALRRIVRELRRENSVLENSVVNSSNPTNGPTSSANDPYTVDNHTTNRDVTGRDPGLAVAHHSHDEISTISQSSKVDMLTCNNDEGEYERPTTIKEESLGDLDESESHRSNEKVATIHGCSGQAEFGNDSAVRTPASQEPVHEESDSLDHATTEDRQGDVASKLEKTAQNLSRTENSTSSERESDDGANLTMDKEMHTSQMERSEPNDLKAEVSQKTSCIVSEYDDDCNLELDDEPSDEENHHSISTRSLPWDEYYDMEACLPKVHENESNFSANNNVHDDEEKAEAVPLDVP